MKKDKELHLFYYQRELSFLREMGAIFATQHPKIAKRLGISEGHAADPHVERLIESFAFLTSYIQKDIDSQFPKISTALLETICPVLVRPIPSMGILEFALDKQQKITSGQICPKGTTVYTESVDSQQNVRFKTVFPIHFQPVEIKKIEPISLRNFNELASYYEGETGLLVKIKSLAGSFARQNIPYLRFFINMPRNQSLVIYSHLMKGKEPIAVVHDKRCHIYQECIPQVVGLTHEDLVLPTESAHLGYALLQEYFAFPEKFFFLDVPLPQGIDHDEMTLVFPLATQEKLEEYHFSSRSLLLHCSPVVNLFEKISEPLLFDHKKVEYKLVPDRRKQKTTEIYAIQNVYTAHSLGEKERVISPYFSYSSEHFTTDNQMFWYARRAPATRGYSGTNIFLSFVDKNAQPLTYAQETIYARTLCTNRALSADIRSGTKFYSDFVGPTSSITSLLEITEPLYPSLEGVNQWKLISMLSTSYLEFSSEKEAVDRLKTLLALLAEKTLSENQMEINSLLELNIKPCVRRMHNYKDWAGFYNGNHLTIRVDEHSVSANHLYLLLSLLNEFFALQSYMHSFSMLSVESNVREGVWHTWQEKAGRAQTL